MRRLFPPSAREPREYGPDPSEPGFRSRRRRLAVFLVLGLFLAMGPIWGLLYTLWQVWTVAAGQSADPVTLGEVRRVTLTLKPTIAGLCLIPAGILLSTWCILRLSALCREEAAAQASRAQDARNAADATPADEPRSEAGSPGAQQPAPLAEDYDAAE